MFEVEILTPRHVINYYRGMAKEKIGRMLVTHVTNDTNFCSGKLLISWQELVYYSGFTVIVPVLTLGRQYTGPGV